MLYRGSTISDDTHAGFVTKFSDEITSSGHGKIHMAEPSQPSDLITKKIECDSSIQEINTNNIFTLLNISKYDPKVLIFLHVIRCPNLRCISVLPNNISQLKIERCFSIKSLKVNLPNLTLLDCTNNNLYMANIVSPKLKVINLCDNNNLDMLSINAPNLVSLIISNTNLGRLPCLDECTKLRTLICGGNKVPFKDDCNYLVDVKLPLSLVNLEIYSCKITNLVVPPKLEYLKFIYFAPSMAGPKLRVTNADVPQLRLVGAPDCLKLVCYNDDYVEICPGDLPPKTSVLHINNF